ncbi:hypothetical protein BDV38DRAFT_239411 [Aspergillus pseudotamarii]|uniref:TauD/TfdA-like domain-containing protein n=1 Tax=Aspergillus pseudotamarii TaxID=132259 RepID=A0A5N6T3B6_ASPPS|nr:uncharacterized protein BDV38DRAFT_239411 [Aspergillus pseudotamarii]KAE8140795.1 hypothetical protein BDV38DRAFT_239411 [Aspergillus pseudotamarii]
MVQYVESIPYFPDRAEYEARARSVPQHEIDAAVLPEGFPTHISSKMAWDRESISSYEDEYILNLNDSQLKEIEDALRQFKALGKPLELLSPATFPLPSLHSILRGISDNIHTGTGFSLVRGIPVDRYSAEENMIIYAGVSSHIGRIRGCQGRKYDGRPANLVVMHITDMRPPSDPTLPVRLAGYTNEDIPFHSDIGDIVSLFALGESAEGGDSQLASLSRVYNELARTRPDIIQVLASDWPIMSSKEEGVLVPRPLLFHQKPSETTPERLLINFSRRWLTGFGDLKRTRLLSVRQAEALDALHFLAERFHLSMKLQKGDMQFFNNWSILHARRGYKDGPQQKRHFLRLWLKDPENAWPTPEQLQWKWDDIYSQGSSPGPQVFPLYPHTT